MNVILTAALGGLAMVAASAAFGQERSSLAPDTGYELGTEPGANGSAQGEPRTFPLFTLGDLDVRVWTPLEPHYNAEANRDPAAEPFWGAG
jgi:hypothetical protein